MAPETDIVILNYNGKKFLDECISSLLRCTYPAMRIFLLDNASTDDDVVYVTGKYPTVQIIRNPLNNGYCAAYNLAFSVCTGKYIVCLNNDVAVEPGWIEYLVDLAESDPSIGAVQPKIISWYDQKKFEYAGSSGGMMDVFGYPFLRGRIFSTIENDEGQYNDPQQVFWTSGAAMFIRRSALELSGNFDNTIVHHMDEIDLCWRLRMSGFKLFVEPKSVIRHIGGATIQTHSFKKVYWNHRNSLYIMLKNYGSTQVLSKVPVHILLDYIAILQALFTGNFVTVGAILKAHIWLILNAGLIFSKRREVQRRRLLPDAAITPFLYKGSVVWEYFIKGRQTFQSLKHYKKNEDKSPARGIEWSQGAATRGL